MGAAPENHMDANINAGRKPRHLLPGVSLEASLDGFSPVPVVYCSRLPDLNLRPICTQIPAPRQHLVRYYGWYGNRARGARKKHGVGAPVEAAAPPTPRSRNWARLLRKIFEVDPMLCPQCGVKMLPVSVVQEVVVIDRILRHLRQVGGNDPWEGTTLRGPPAA